MKTCSHCKHRKETSGFWRNRSTKDGYEYFCKVCSKKANRKYRASHFEKVYAKKKEWTQKNAQKHRDYHKKWRVTHPERLKIGEIARKAVLSAVRSGRLKRKPCRECGRVAQAHHPDYSRPLSVVWLCPSHHQKEHANV